MKSLIRLLNGYGFKPPTRRPTMPETSMGILKHNHMNGEVREYWWTAQDQDAAWARQWEGDTDTTDPRSYK